MSCLRGGVRLILLGAALIGVSSGRADEARSPLAGTWKLSISIQGQDIALAILKIDIKDGKTEASVLATGAKTFAGAQVESARAGERSLHLAFTNPNATFRVAVYGSKDTRRPRLLVGSLETRNNIQIAVLERTTEKELDPATLVAPTEGAAELKRLGTADDKEREIALKEILDKYPDRPVAFAAAQRVWQTNFRRGKTIDQVRAGNAFVAVAGRFGREMELGAALQVAKALLSREEDQATAIEFAKRADKLLTAEDAPGRQIHVLQLLTAALRKEVKVNTAALKEAGARTTRIEEQLDQAFVKTAIPFKIEPFAGRKGMSKRVAVVELFTGVHSAPCASGDIVFDALLKTYQPSDVVLLQYHVHAPAPDPLTNADSEERAEYYKAEAIPKVFLNGRAQDDLSGSRTDAEGKYKELRKGVDRALEKEAKARVELEVKRDGANLAVTATVTALDSKGARLRVFLVEDVVRYPGANGQRLHHQVVRALLADVEATVAKGEANPRRFTIAIGDLRKSLSAYLERVGRSQRFVDEIRPLELKHLKVVAIVQEKERKEILNAVQTAVPER